MHHKSFDTLDNRYHGFVVVRIKEMQIIKLEAHAFRKMLAKNTHFNVSYTKQQSKLNIIATRNNSIVKYYFTFAHAISNIAITGK